MADEDRTQLLEVIEWIKGHNDGVIRIGGYPEAKTKWFIVSTKWLKKWKKINKLSDDCDEDGMEEDLGQIDSEDIIDSDPSIKTNSNYILKPGLIQGMDYEILPKKAWDFLAQKYGFNHKIVRKSIEINNDETQIEITLFHLNVIIVMHDQIKSIEPFKFYVSRNKSLLSVKKALSTVLLQTQLDYNSRLWKLNRDTKVEELDKLLENNTKPLIFPGVLLDGTHQNINTFEISFDDIVVLECRRSYGMDIFKEKDKEQCEYCKRHTFGGHRCQCKKFYYCNDMCEEKDRNFHYCRKNSKVYVLNERSCLGKAGLQNLGNTCYMNSGLQCLSNTCKLTKYILDDEYLSDINRENRLGSKGELITEYAALIKEMWYGSSRYVSPWGLKRAFSEFAKQFIGFHQQDSQEMLSFLIDGIHEDLNRVKVKPYTQDPDEKGLSEKELADKFWKNHLSRNDSIIVDLMHGQYRSEVECPQCGKSSVTFDPFLMLTLPIPEKDIKLVEFTYVDFNKSIKAKVSLQKGFLAGDLKLKACELLQINPDNIFITETNMGSLKSILPDTAKVSKRTSILLYNKLQTDNDLIDDDFAILFVDFRKKSYGYAGIIIGQPHLVKVSKDIELKELYAIIFKYVLNLKKEEVSDFEELFKQKFPGFFNRPNNDNFFAIKVHNPYQFPCAVCDRVSCPGCPIQYEPKKFSKYLAKCKEPNLRISVTFGEQFYDTGFLTNLENHSSCYSINENKTQETLHISECFSMFSRKEKLDENNTSYCSNCKEHVQGLKKMDIYKLPNILVIHFKRFKQKGYFSSKNNKVVDFPLEGLDMEPFSLGCSGIYDLYAVSNHYGSLEGGHYTAYAKSQDGVWRDFDDSSVSLVTNVKETIVASSAYVLFYQKRDNT